MIRNALLATLMIFSLLGSSFSYANDGPKPPDHITSITIAKTAAEHYFSYAHYTPIGTCFWWKCPSVYCYVYPTLELDEYLPDLIVTVYTGQGNDPWYEANVSIDKVGYALGNVITHGVTGHHLGNGDNSSQSQGSHANSTITKSADVIGNPFALFHFPFMNLRVDTEPYEPYFQSDLDVLGGRSGLAEDLRPSTWNPFTHFIGNSFENHWGYEFPRSMTVVGSNDYKAAIMIAQHAADIVTNRNLLHVVKSSDDSCGTNCAVSNVIEESKDKHEIWEEIYPHDRHIHPGRSDLTNPASTGAGDDQKGRGNYVFVVWRHYRGCVQGDHFIYATVPVGPTNKR